MSAVYKRAHRRDTRPHSGDETGTEPVRRGALGALGRASPARALLPVGMAIFVWAVWALYMHHSALWSLFESRWGMSLTMVFGSFIAGATSEGGGAVAFPAMTLLFDIHPAVARDFALMIQAVGMTAASILIIVQGIKVEWRAVIFGSIGGIVGMTVGLTAIAPHVPPPHAKIFFTSLWLSFALALYLVNRNRAREVFDAIQGFRPAHAALLASIGVLGGIVGSITGSGLDILTFSVLVLGLRVSESIGTPTSVLLMAANAIVGFAWKYGALGGMEPEAFRFWYVCIPVVVVGAPLGARVIRNVPRLHIANFLYASIVVQFVFALIVIPLTGGLLLTSCLTLGAGSALFWWMGRLGRRQAMR